MKDISLNQFRFDGLRGEKITDLTRLGADDQRQLLMAGVDVQEQQRSGTFMHLDHRGVYCKATRPGVEILDITDALDKYDGLPQYFWQLAEPGKDIFTEKAHATLQGGYFVRAEAGVKLVDRLVKAIAERIDAYAAGKQEFLDAIRVMPGCFQHIECPAHVDGKLV